MSAFKRHFHDLGKDGRGEDWPGSVYQCNLMVKRPGKDVLEQCGVKVPAKNSNTSGLRTHMRDHHPEEFAATSAKKGNILAYCSKDKVTQPEKAAAAAEKRVTRQMKKRAKADEEFAALVQKRLRS